MQANSTVPIRPNAAAEILDAGRVLAAVLVDVAADRARGVAIDEALTPIVARLGRIEAILERLAGAAPSDSPKATAAIAVEAAELPALLSVEAVAKLLSVSVRTVRRMYAGHALPEPVRLKATYTRRRRHDTTGNDGELPRPGRGKLRWQRDTILNWVQAGMPNPAT